MLTVVVPTIPGRESLLSRCLHSCAGGPATVLVVDGDGRLGDKVTAASQHVDTEYMTVVDDDDYLAGDYFVEVMPRLDGVVDYVGFKVLELDGGRFVNITATSAEFNRWGRRQRGPVPKGISRTDIFRRVPFGNDYYADRKWLAGAHRIITAWDFIDRALYIHDWWSSSSTFYENGQRDVGIWPHGDVERLTVN